MNYSLRTRSLTFLLLLLSLVLVACGGEADASGGEEEAKWMASAHADVEARAFSRWNDDDPAVISENCAKCHSTTGYRDFLGLDGATPGQVDEPAPVGTTVECEACHNEVSAEKTSVIVPSGEELTDLGAENNCMECHQGRTSKVTVDEATAGMADDVVNDQLSFVNIHNKAAAPTQYGTLAKGGFEYDRKGYVEHYGHVAEFSTCIECHDAHSQEVVGEKCSACHIGADSRDGRQKIRANNIDYDGDGSISEGMADEINTMREGLLQVIRLKAAVDDNMANIIYEERNPYFFDENGEGYSTWTPELLRAAYNYHYTTKEPGGYAHNGLYHIQLLYDSMEDLGMNMASMVRPAVE